MQNIFLNLQLESNRMPKSNLPTNTIRLDIQIDQNTDVVNLRIAHNLSITMEEVQSTFYLDMINGLSYKIKCEAEPLAFQGELLREIATLREIIDEDDLELSFEPDEELLEKVREKQEADNVLAFKKKLH